MSSTILERLRSAREDIESYERAVVNILDTKARTHRERVMQGHRVNIALDRVVERSKEAMNILADADGSRKEELRSMRGSGVFTSFYDRLREIREYHKKYPEVTVLNEPDMSDVMNPSIQFSGEEMFGKYIDLHAFYQRSLNNAAFKTYKNLDYIKYLSCFHQFSEISSAKKREEEYISYLQDLYDYLNGFYRRTQPLVDFDDIMNETEETFQNEWKQKKVKGWEDAEDDEDVNNPLFCQCCDKIFATKGVYTAHLGGKKHKRAVQLAESGDGGDNVPNRKMKDRGIALLEEKVKKMRYLLAEVVDATKGHIELKQTRTHEELQAEIQEEEEGVLPDVDLDEEEEDDDMPFYNPLNLPLGWDGKPIPYWLYKLHGLGVEFKCEICGNYSYWGRRAFDRHFQEWRHAHGMRCLKIPNTKHFHDITLIEDAINLYEKIKDQLEHEVWLPDNEEEYEDTDGNVLNKKTFEDLSRQGLL